MRTSNFRAFVPWRKAAFPCIVLGFLLSLTLPSCLVSERCFSQADCEATELCLANGKCGFECSSDLDCGPGLRCSENRCLGTSAGPLVCPGGMVSVADSFCIDQFEASRKDATLLTAGTEETVAVSQKGVLPWQVRDNATAQAGCEAAGKTLCTAQQWRFACQGSTGTTYGYGNSYEPKTCNGIDLFGKEQLLLLATGSLPQCKSNWGVYDINGNLWEHVALGNDSTVRGGAYNCLDSQGLHRCDYVPGNWTPSARGFRCCLLAPSSDAGLDAEVSTDSSVNDVSIEIETGCIEEDAPDSSLDVSTESPFDTTMPLADTGAEQLAATDSADQFSSDSADSTSQEGGTCPAEMVRILSFCMDRYEASHADATAISAGTSAVASSASQVIPWFPVTLPEARGACEAAGKRLCRLEEWIEGCSGPTNNVYSYGNSYQPAVCNGIDTFCSCSSSSCGGLSQCPYPHCFSQASAEGPGPCGAQFHVVPTGSFASCLGAYGAYDLNGNVWELADSTDGMEHFRGGAYNCGDSEALHRCDHDGIWGPSARGFRCCKDGEP